MGYERNDRRFDAPNDRYGSGGSYGGYGPDRGRQGYGGQDRGHPYGADYGPNRSDNRDRDRRDENERGFFDRAGDEVRSWFGDDEAERRRRRDEAEAERDYRRHYGASSRSADQYRDPGYGPGLDASGGAYGPSSDRGRRDEQRGQHDHGYQSWRDRQMSDFDRDYDEYRREHQSRFDSEFRTWREQRQGQRELLGKVQEHQEVVGSDGAHIGTVDHVRGDRIRLTKTDSGAGGHHHSIPLSWVQSVEDKVTVSKTADQAKQHWRDEERSDQGAFGWRDDDDRGRTNLNRSFSGTY
jgi:hypothetical protein